MEIRKFNLETDLDTINKWNKRWNLSPIQDWWLPVNNYIIDDVIFASMYLTDSKLAYMENVIGNRDCPSEKRVIALGKLGEFIFATAKELGYKACLGWTCNKSVAKNSGKHGMILTEFNNACMVKLL